MSRCKWTDRRRLRYGFTLIELLVVIAASAILIGLLMPSLRMSREPARRMSCSNNFKQLGLSMHNYHAAYNQLPPAMGGTGRFRHADSQAQHGLDNAGRLSGLVAMLPFFEEQALWEQIAAPLQNADVSYPAFGPAPTVPRYDPWAAQVRSLRCPSDPAEKLPFGLTNYTFCIGDAARDLYHEKTSASGDSLPPRGVFAAASQRVTRFRDVVDGLTNTVAMMEIANNMDRLVSGQYAVGQPASFLAAPATGQELLDPDRPAFYQDSTALSAAGRGGRWADGAAGVALVNTILPPNSISFAVGGEDAVDGIYSGGSYHQGGIHALMADGAVKFIANSIEAGDATSAVRSAWYQSVEPTGDHTDRASPHGLWGALGSAAGQDQIGNFE